MVILTLVKKMENKYIREYVYNSEFSKLNQYIELLDDGEVKSAIQKIKTDEIELLNDIHSVDDLASYYSEFLTRVESIAKNIIDAFIKDTKDDAKAAIDVLYNKISSAIDDETVVNGAKEIADSAKSAIDDIETLSDIKTVYKRNFEKFR